MQTGILRPLSFQQNRLWSLRQEIQHSYARCSVMLEGKLNIENFLQALEQVVDRNAILRTQLHHSPVMDVPMQLIVDHINLSCPVVDIECLCEAEQAEQLDWCFNSLRREPCDLEQGPLWRVWLLRLSPQRHVVLLGCSGLCAAAAGVGAGVQRRALAGGGAVAVRRRGAVAAGTGGGCAAARGTPLLAGAAAGGVCPPAVALSALRLVVACLPRWAGGEERALL